MTENKKKRIKELEEMIEAVILSIPREIASQKYYQKALEKASSSTTMNFFKTFVEEEKRHERNLKKILQDLQAELKQLKKSE
jgi:rubrerythrin